MSFVHDDLFPLLVGSHRWCMLGRKYHDSGIPRWASTSPSWVPNTHNV